MSADVSPWKDPLWCAGVAAALETSLAREPVQARGRLEWLPVASLRSGAVVARRAQLGWAHPRLGLLSRTEFEAAARRTDALARLDTWALHAAIDHLARTSPVGRAAVPVEVPVAAQTLQQPYLAERLRGRCQAAGVDPALLRVVVQACWPDDAGLPDAVEASGAPDAPDAPGTCSGAPPCAPLHALAEAGLGLVLADAARSRVALGTLVGLPVAALELPMPWVRETMREPGHGCARMGALTRLARALGGDLQVTGVDRPGDLDLLHRARVPAAQGPAVPVSSGGGAHAFTI